MTNKGRKKSEIDVPDNMRLETMKKKACPICGKPMRWLDGDFICVACNGGEYGPEEG
jgi:uncharacterized Zn finger protein (UPF0148 family)